MQIDEFLFQFKNVIISTLCFEFPPDFYNDIKTLEGCVICYKVLGHSPQEMLCEGSFFNIGGKMLGRCNLHRVKSSESEKFDNLAKNPAMKDISGCVCVSDFEAFAKTILDKKALGYYASGATDQQTLTENCSAFKSWRFQPMILRDVSTVDSSTDILGHKIPFPVCITPTGLYKVASPGGEISSAKAADDLKTGYTLSSWLTSSTCIQDIAKEVPSVLRYLQLYVYKDRDLTRNLVKTAEKYGYKAIIVTVDTPVQGRRYQDMRNKFSLPPQFPWKHADSQRKYDVIISESMKNSVDSQMAESVAALIDPSLIWDDIEWLKTITKLPIIVKGILTAEMALEAVQHGVNGILVSNHGARQLDGVLPTINALPQVVKAVNGRCEVFLDGGVRNGGDVAKAIALGAKAVFVGRPIIWGLTCGGEAGVKKVLEILRDEFVLTMKLLGVTSIKELQSTPNLVIHESKILSKL